MHAAIGLALCAVGVGTKLCAGCLSCFVEAGLSAARSFFEKLHQNPRRGHVTTAPAPFDLEPAKGLRSGARLGLR